MRKRAQYLTRTNQVLEKKYLDGELNKAENSQEINKFKNKIARIEQKRESSFIVTGSCFKAEGEDVD